MSEQLGMFDPRTGRVLGELGMARTLEAEREEWIVDALKHLRFFVAAYPTFRMEQFRAWYLAQGHRPHSHKCWGAFTSRAAREGVIRFTGRFEESTSPKTHGHWVKCWSAA